MCLFMFMRLEVSVTFASMDGEDEQFLDVVSGVVHEMRENKLTPGFVRPT